MATQKNKVAEGFIHHMGMTFNAADITSMSEDAFVKMAQEQATAQGARSEVHVNYSDRENADHQVKYLREAWQMAKESLAPATAEKTSEKPAKQAPPAKEG